MSDGIDFLAADWPAPAHIRAGTTLRGGGASAAPFDSANLADHVGDTPAAVVANRKRLQTTLALPSEPAWLDQVHGIVVADLDAGRPVEPADAAIATRGERVPVVLTADCLPVLFCDRAGECYGAAHAGWRSLAGGVLEATIAALAAPPDELMAWLGPAIGPANFEVGADVRDAFCRRDDEQAVAFVPATTPGKYRADLYALARRRLARAGVMYVFGQATCTSADPARFYSYRRDGRTGRMASLVWAAG